MTRALGRDHGNVNVSGRYDLTEVNGEAVSEHEHVASLEVGFDVLLVHSRLLLVINKNHDDVSLLGSLGSGEYLKALSLSLCP